MFDAGSMPETMTHRFDQETRTMVKLPEAEIEALKRSYDGKWVAVERCPHYWRKAGAEDLY
jgi:hypothetical protein